MLVISGSIYCRCIRCGHIHKIDLDSTGMEMTTHEFERQMGLEIDYHFYDSYRCRCGNTFSINIYACEYPPGDVECGITSFDGIEITNDPHLVAYYEPDERINFEDNKYTRNDLIRIIQEMSHRQFELFVGSIFFEMGFENVVVTQRTRDGGYDFCAEDNRNGIRNRIVGECKHYSIERKVGEDIVRKLHDVQNQKNANMAIVVTSSIFTREAKKRAKEYNMSLWDVDDVIQYGKHLLKNYV